MLFLPLDATPKARDMSAHNYDRWLVIGSMTLFAACGGGDTGQTPPVASQGASPTPAPSAAAIVIFANPSPQEYASLGASTTSAGDGYTPVAPSARLTDVSLVTADQPLLRYTASGNYEIRLPGMGFDRLVPYVGLLNPTADNNFFQPANARQNSATFVIERSSLDGYRYSELATWTDATAPPHLGSLAFGSSTPSAAIAASGRATYRGRASGTVDIPYLNNLFGGTFFSGATGTVTLTVDFAARRVTGTLAVSVEGNTVVSVVPLSAAMSPGADIYSGLFETSQSGFNEFKVRLTGPEASELIGSWAVPITVDGEPHQFIGAWIAARD